MPQAVSPRYLTVSPPGAALALPRDRRPQAPKLKAQINPREWSPERVARYYQKHGTPSKSPIMAKIVLDKKLDGHALIDTPEDILEHLAEEYPELQEEMRATASELRSKAGQTSPSSRLPRAQDIALALAEQSETPIPSLSASPEVFVEEHPPSPQTPPEWDLDDDSEEGQQHAEGSMPPWLRFSSPSSVPQLLRPLVAVSPGPYATFELSALEVLDPQRASEFASADPAEVAESDMGAVDGGDHPELQQPQDDLLGRRDASPAGCEQDGNEVPHGEAGYQHRSRLLHTTARPSVRAQSCPPSNRLSLRIPPLPPLYPSAAKTYASIAIQASEEPRDDHAVLQDGDLERLRHETHSDPGEADILGDLCQVDESGAVVSQDDDSEETADLVHTSDMVLGPDLPVDTLSAATTLSPGVPINPPKSPKPPDVALSTPDNHSSSPKALITEPELRRLLDVSQLGRASGEDSEARKTVLNVSLDVPHPSPLKDQQDANSLMSFGDAPHNALQPDDEADGWQMAPTTIPPSLAVASHDEHEISGESSDEWQSFKSPYLSAASAPTTPVQGSLTLLLSTPRPGNTNIELENAIEDALEDNIPLARLAQSHRPLVASHTGGSNRDIESGFTVVGSQDIQQPTSPRDSDRMTRRTRSQRSDSVDTSGWQSMSGEESEDSEAAWNLSDTAEKGLVEHTASSDPEKTLLSPRHTFPARLVTDSLQVMTPKPERSSPMLSASLSRGGRDSAREESKSGWHAGFFNKITSAVGFSSSSPSSPAPPTPGEETDAEAFFQEMTDAEVATLSKPDREKYKKKLRKMRQRLEKRMEETRSDSLYL